MATIGTKPMNTAQKNEDQNGLIVIEEERLKESFTQIPNTILRRPELSAGAKLTYMLLLSYAWQQDSCFPGQSTLASDLGAGRRSVIRYLQELQEVGLLRVKRRGLGKTNLYTLARWERSGSARMASPEMPFVTPQDVPDWHRKNTHANDTQKHEDSSSNQFDGDDQGEPIGPGSNHDESSKLDRGHPVRRDSPGLTSVRATLLRYRTEQGLPRTGMQIPSEKSPSGHTADSRGRPQARSPQIEALIDEFSSDLGDSTHSASNTGQALRLWAQCGLSERVFVARLYEARSRTRQAALMRGTSQGKVSPIRKRMPYFFACLRDALAPARDTVTPPHSEQDSNREILETGTVRV